MKNIKSVLLVALSVPLILLSCKKVSTSPKEHVFTSSQTVTETITATATINKNSSGQWIVSGSSSENPVIDSLQISGDISFQIYNNSTYYTTLTTSNVVGQIFSDQLTGVMLTNPTLQQVFYEPSNTTSLGSIDYTVNYQ